MGIKVGKLALNFYLNENYISMQLNFKHSYDVIKSVMFRCRLNEGNSTFINRVTGRCAKCRTVTP